jgi:hypothetical protein
MGILLNEVAKLIGSKMKRHLTYSEVANTNGINSVLLWRNLWNKFLKLHRGTNKWRGYKILYLESVEHLEFFRGGGGGGGKKKKKKKKK